MSIVPENQLVLQTEHDIDMFLVGVEAGGEVGMYSDVFVDCVRQLATKAKALLAVQAHIARINVPHDEDVDQATWERAQQDIAAEDAVVAP